MSRLPQRPSEWGAQARKPKQVEAKGCHGLGALAEDLALTVSGILYGQFMLLISHIGAFYPRQWLLPPATQSPHTRLFTGQGAALKRGVVAVDCLPEDPAPQQHR